MDASTSFIVGGLTGCPVDLIIYNDGETRLVKSVVHNATPLSLRVEAGSVEGLRPALRVMLISMSDGVALRADGHLDQIRTESGEFFADLSSVHWEILDRRRHDRLPVNLPISLRLVTDHRHETVISSTEGTAVDMSISGAFVAMKEMPVPGSLVEFNTVLSGEPVRALAVVAYLSELRGGAGVHFVEYLGNARQAIHSYLSAQAA